MAGKERAIIPSDFNEYLKIQEECQKAQETRICENRQKKLKKAILSKWEELLAIQQSEIPNEIREVAEGNLSKAAATVLWMSPSPWARATKKDEGSVKKFIQESQAEIWKKGRHKSVIRYFKNIVEDNWTFENMPPIPTSIRTITKERMSQSALKTLWVMPSPWLWGEDERDEKLDFRRSPSVMWHDGHRDLVTDYMKVLANNLDKNKHK